MSDLVGDSMEQLIQERVRKLRENTDFALALFEDLVGYAIVAADFDGNVIAYNEGACQVFGYTTDEVIGKQNIEVFFPKELIEEGRLQILIGDLLGKERFTYEGESIRKNGTRFPAQFLLTLAKDKNDRVIGLIEIVQDLTERKRIEEIEALRRSEEHFRSLIENASDLITVLNAQGIMQYQSPSVERILGYKPEELIGRNGFEFVHPDDIPKIQAAFIELLQNPNASPSIEIRFRHKNGSWRVLETKSKNLVNEHGSLQIVVNSRDITERKQAEEEYAQLLLREQIARAKAEEAVDMVRRLQAITDTALAHLSLKDLLPKLLNRLKELLDADTIVILLVAEDEQHLVVKASIGLEGEVAEGLQIPIGQGIAGRIAVDRETLIVNDLATEEVESLVLRAKGIRSIVGVPLMVEGRVIGVVHAGAFRPYRFTDRDALLLQLVADRIGLAIEHARLYEEEQAARIEAEAAQQRLAFLAHASSVLSASLDYQTRLDTVADLVVPYLADWCFVGLIGENGLLHRIAVAHADPSKADLARNLEQAMMLSPDTLHSIFKVLQTGHPEIYPEISDSFLLTMTHDPEHLKLLRQLNPRSYLCVPLQVQGRPLGAITFLSVESGRRYNSADLALAEDFANRVAAPIENARLYQEAQEADRRKDEFLAILGHELRNPLAPVRNALEIMRLRSGNDPTLKRAMDIVERQIQHMTRLVDDLLDISRIIRGKVQLKKEPLDLNTIITRAIETSQPFIENRQHGLLVSLPQEPLWVEGDPARLEQILVNLLNNAAKYTEPGGRIWLTCTQEGEEAVIRIRDTGIGIPPEMLLRIFDLFTQASQSLDRSQGGLGIGLTLVRSLVQMHGGSVSAFSEGLGRGSEFVVRLPVLSETGSRTLNPDSVDPKPKILDSKRRVLVVDDNVDAATTLSELIKLWGHEVYTAYDGPSAVEAALTYLPDIVLLDIGLPGMDGYEVARQLRQEPRLSKTLLIALTGYGQEKDQQYSQEVGFDQHFTKPVDIPTLQRILGSQRRE
ncbi:MAG TPA: PAS domain S-box protein [Candidatus Limnocylindrales bacterium]|nr:PAS domain S-box protein [Candidatus Limnocylindrales bacterium]